MSIWQDLIGNLAVVALSVFGWEALSIRFEFASTRRYNLAFAVVMGVSAVVSMVLSVNLPGGAIFDLRSALIAIAGFFGGPLAGLVAGAIAAVYRLGLGGTGMFAGLCVVAAATFAGIAGNLLARRRPDAVWQVMILSVAAAGAMLIGILLLPSPIGQNALRELGVPVLGLTFLATLVSGMIILSGRRLSDERRLLSAAMHQSPDFQYVKNRQSQFVVANRHVADYHGFSDPTELRGKTDFDISPAEHAAQLFDQEQRILFTGRPLREHVECIPDRFGNSRWYSTSKTAVTGRDGEVIGFAGVTHDITRQKKTEAELMQSRNLLSNAVSGMSDGLAMFDADDVLMFCNEQYREIFSLTAAYRVPGAHLRDILQAVVEVDEQVGIPVGGEQEWIDSVVATVHETTEREVNLKNGRWLRVRSRRTKDGISTVTVSDITQAKLAQQALLALTDQLKSLAGTDGLTGLPNRRAFDHALLEQLEKTERRREPLSLLMIDVDHFKSFNDAYGHLAGDECLKAIAHCLRHVALKPQDLAARFGGEEFALILPGSGADAANLVAEDLRDLLSERAIPQSSNKSGIVTVSIGIASCSAGDTVRRVAEIVRHADEALYQAKGAGRDRVVIWSGAQAQESIEAA